MSTVSGKAGSAAFAKKTFLGKLYMARIIFIVDLTRKNDFHYHPL